jgi:glutaredoxin 3
MAQVKVYTMEYCPYCVQAKNLLKRRGIAFEEIMVSTDDEAQWDALYRLTGMKTLPLIFHGERLVGGYQELAELDRTDQLQSLKV